MGSGFRIGDNSPIDDRLVYPTVDSVFLPASQGGIVSARRHVGLKIYITSEEKFYFFKDGVNQVNFVEFEAGGGGNVDPSNLISLDTDNALVLGSDSLFFVPLAKDGTDGTDGTDGIDGLDGRDGKDGTGFMLAGTATNVSELPVPGTPGYSYVIPSSSDPNIWEVWAWAVNDGAYVNLGPVTAGLVTSQSVSIGESFIVTNGLSSSLPPGTTIGVNDDLFHILKMLLRPVTHPTYTAPSLSLSGSGALNVEIGSNITPTLTPTFFQNDGGLVSAYRLYKNGTVLHTTLSSFTDVQFQITDNITYNSQVDYDQGPIKNDSEGNPFPTGQIPAGTANSNNVVYRPGRRAFFGSLTMPVAPINSADVRGLTSNELNPVSGTELVVNVPIGSRGVAFAYPVSLGAPQSISSQLIGNIPIGSFTRTDISVSGANGFDPVTYAVYSITATLPFTSNDVYRMVI